MASAAKFLFNTDFRQPAQDTKQDAAIAEAEARGYMRGLTDGQRQAETEAQIRLAETQERLSGVMDSLANSVGLLLDGLDRHKDETEALAIEFATALGRKLAGDVIAREPLAAMAAAAAESFQHLRGVPHVVVRVNESLVEAVDDLIRRMARERGFEGRIVTLGEPDTALGDVRLEWADGGVALDRQRIDEAVAQALRGLT